MRAFIGIDFSSEFKSEIIGLQSELKRYSTSGRWKYIDNFHITLRFLDEIDERMQKSISISLRELCRNFDEFMLQPGELGFFPESCCYRVVWLGLKGNLENLKSLQKEIVNITGKLGLEKDNKSFKPHITLGQDVTFEKPFEHLKKVASNISISNIKVNQVCLFKSEQVGKKRIYTPIDVFSLKHMV